MRDIRFRAWDGVNMVGACCVVDSYFQLQGGRSCGNFMQFTGLHDKNGKEIYEGDILKYISIHDDAYMLDKDSRITGVVVYYQERCQFLPQEIMENHKGGHYISTWEFTEDIEVIGNIHENPELLEGLS